MDYKMGDSFYVTGIVSVKHLNLLEKDKIHMCLANVARLSDEYKEFYKRKAKEGCFVLMDNGAAEGDQPSNEEILSLAKEINPTELILTDTLYDSADTVRRSTEALNLYKEGGLTCGFMVVPQGKNLEDWEDCLRKLLALDGVTSVGVSKFISMWEEKGYCEVSGDDARYKALEVIEKVVAETGKDVGVHLLGSHIGVFEIKRVKDAFKRVRSSDSAFAYIAAQAGVEVGLDVRRPKGEIDFVDGVVDEDLLDKNLQSIRDLLNSEE